jgi:parallel beta-helix repeat protein
LNQKGLAVGLILLLIGTSVFPITAQDTEKPLPSSRGNRLYVGGSGPGNYTRIQDAIDDSRPGDIVFVFSGKYNESLLINKSDITLVGEDENLTIIDGGMRDNVIEVKTGAINIQGFTIQNSSINLFNDIGIHASIDVGTIRGIQISHCIFKKVGRGIYFYNVSDCSITRCQIHNLNSTSITIYGLSNNVSIDHCLIKDCGTDWGGAALSGGISLHGHNIFNCTNVTVSNNVISNVAADGLYMFKIFNLNIFNNSIHNCSWWGICLGRSQNVNIYENTIFKNLKNGIMTDFCEVKISSNRIYDNGNGSYFDGGILIQDSKRNASIVNNRLEANVPYGVYLIRSPGSTIVNNTFVQNKQNAYILSTLTSHWHGNYWDDWSGLGPKIILGRWSKIRFPWVNVDWHPAQGPYDIGA